MVRLVLGSSSRWRRELFDDVFCHDEFKRFQDILGPQLKNVESEFMAADIDEKAIRDPDPKMLCQKVAQAKAKKLIPDAGNEGFLICMDEVVVTDGKLREKPETKEEAKEFLQAYAKGLPAECLNGVCVVNLETGRMVTGLEEAVIYFEPFTDEVIDRIVERGLVFQCSGGFTIKDPDLSQYVSKIYGTENAIEGLPEETTRKLISEARNPAIKRMIWDLDGTLLNSEEHLTKARKQMCEKYKTENDFTPDIDAKILGGSWENAAKIIIDSCGFPLTVEKYLEEEAVIVRELWKDTELMPGVKEVLEEGIKRNIPMAIATSSRKVDVDLKIAKHKELFDRAFKHIVTCDDVTKTKPDPEIFLKANNLFGPGVEPKEVLIFEDSPNGIRAALKGGFRSIMIPPPHVPKICQMGDRILTSLTEFDANFFF